MAIGYFNLASINPQDVFLSVALIVSFFVFNLAFSSFFNKESKGISWIPALALSIGTTYGLWRSNFNINVLTSNTGISPNLLFIIAGVLIIGVLFYFLKKAKLRKKGNVFSFIIGLVLLFFALTGRIYQRESGILIGIILLIIGIHPLLKKYFSKKKNKNK